MRTGLDSAFERACRMIGTTTHRRLGEVRAAESVAFARASAEHDRRFLDPGREDFRVHPMYLPSLLRGPDGADTAEYRPDGMFADEVPGTAGLDVRLLAGGQTIEFCSTPPLGVPLEVTRTVNGVDWKGSDGGEFLLITVSKSYRVTGSVTLAIVTERFIVR
nr:hypothetical protein [Rhodococcus wratislaviensis]